MKIWKIYMVKMMKIKNKEVFVTNATLLLNILISIFLSIDMDREYYINIKSIFVIFIILSIFSLSIKNYFFGEDFISFTTIKSDDGSLYRLLGFVFLLFLYIITILFFIYKAMN